MKLHDNVRLIVNGPDLVTVNAEKCSEKIEPLKARIETGGMSQFMKQSHPIPLWSRREIGRAARQFSTL
jgi:hypothetical protein